MKKVDVQCEEVRREARVTCSGRLRFFTKLSSSFALFALDLDNELDYGKFFQLDSGTEEQARTKILDVILTRKDGWTQDMIDELMINITSGNSTIAVSGYPERRKEKFKENSNVFCIIAVDVNLGETGKSYKAEPPKEDSGISEAIKTAETSEITNTTEGHIATNSNNENDDKGGNDNSMDDDGHRLQRTDKKRKRLKNSDRGANDNSRFAKLVFFLLSEFGGYDGLGTLPVFDIAGGSGGLAFELVFKHQIACTVVDTRQVQFSAGQKAHLEFRKQCYDALVKIGADKTTPLVENLKSRFQAGVSDDGLLRQLQTLLETEAVLRGLPSSKIGKRPDFVKSNEELRNLLMNKRCSVLVGMHPDQATDPIMDIGFALNLPWVVIPCCVFPKLFDQRQLKPSGNPVRTYDDLCEYILQQHPGVKETTLPFRGRNRVFYWKPSKEEAKQQHDGEH